MRSLPEVARRVYSDLIRRRSRVIVAPPSVEELTAPPIFVLGLYRSGTTLVRYVLDSHSAIACPPESDFLHHLEGLAHDERAQLGLGAMGFDQQHIMARMRRFGAGFFEGYTAAMGKRRWADKSPQYVEHADFIADLFEDALFVVVLRHPLDQVDSAINAGEAIRAEVARFGTAGEDRRVSASRYWARQTERLLDFAERDPERCHLLRYEELCGDPEAVARDLFSFLGEEWEPQVLRFHEVEHSRGKEDGRVLATRGFQISTGKYRSWPTEVQRSCGDVVREVAVRAGYRLGE